MASKEGNTLKFSEKKDWILRICIIVLAFAFIAVGVLRQEELTVLKKAVNICLQCIGIG